MQMQDVSLVFLKLASSVTITLFDMDHFRFLGNCPPTPPLSHHHHLLLT